MATLDTSYLVDTMEEVVRSEVRDQFQLDVSVLWNIFQSLGEEEISARGTFIPIGLDFNTSNAWLPVGSGEGGDLPVPDVDVQKRMRVDYSVYAKGFEMTGVWMRLQKSKRNIARGISNKFRAYTEDIKVEIGQQLWLDGSGKKAVTANNAISGSLATAGVIAGTGTPGAAIATGANGWVRCGIMPDEGWTLGASQIYPRMRMNIVSSAGVVRAAGGGSLMIVASVDNANAKVVFDQVPTDAAIGDYLVYEGSYGNAIVGMQKHVDNAATNYQALSRSTYKQLTSIVYDAANTPLTYGLMTLISRVAVFRRDNRMNDPGQGMVVTSPTQIAIAESFFHGLKRATNDETTFRVGMEKLVVAGVPWEWDAWCQEDEVYFLQKQSFIKLMLMDIGLIDDDGKTMRMKISTTGGLRKWAVSGWFGFIGQLAGLEPRANAKIKRLDVTASGVRRYLYAVA